MIGALAVGVLGVSLAAQGVVDREPPIIEFASVAAPRDISGGGAVDGSCQATIHFEATIADNCCIEPDGIAVEVVVAAGSASLGAPSISKTHVVGPEPPAPPEGMAVILQGHIDVTLTGCSALVEVRIAAQDCSGNEAPPVTWSRGVSDDAPPVFTFCPPDIERFGHALRLDVGMAVAEDNCSAPTVIGVRSDGLALIDLFPQGLTTITWTATDACGNAATCLQSVELSMNAADMVDKGSGSAPTLSQWGMIALLSLLSVFFVRTVQCRVTGHQRLS
jgi:hypothetical protein